MNARKWMISSHLYPLSPHKQESIDGIRTIAAQTRTLRLTSINQLIALFWKRAILRQTWSPREDHACRGNLGREPAANRRWGNEHSHRAPASVASLRGSR